MKVDFVIAGGGIIGIMSALKIKERFPRAEVALFEKERYWADHTTGRNSGVLHAGIYYPYGSLKHLLCLEGNRLWQEMARSQDLSLSMCGKYIFSQSPQEQGALEALLDKAQRNGVSGIRRTDSSELQEISNHIHCHDALFSPGTGILEVASAMSYLINQAQQKEVYLLKCSKIVNLERNAGEFSFEVNGEKMTAAVFVNASGLEGVGLREQLGLSDLKNQYVKGNYITTSQKLDYKVLYYPIPPSNLKGLGVHSTIDFDQRVKFGPNTEDVSSIDYGQTKDNLQSMIPNIVRSFKGVDPSRLHWDYCGIRPKVMHSATDELHNDFWIKSPLPGYIELLGIESPGLTAAPAIAAHLLGFV